LKSAGARFLAYDRGVRATTRTEVQRTEPVRSPLRPPVDVSQKGDKPALPKRLTIGEIARQASRRQVGRTASMTGYPSRS
jgi:hypothetical protein